MTNTPLTPEERLARLEGVYEHLATKADLARVEGGLKADIVDLRGSFRTLLLAATSVLALLNIVLRFWPA